MNNRQEILQKIELGIEAEAFLKTPVGAAMLERMQEKLQEALLALMEADPEDAKEIRRLQNEAKVADNFMKIVAEIIQEGLHGEELLQQEDN